MSNLPLSRRIEKEGFKIIDRENILTKKGIITRRVFVESEKLRGCLEPYKAELHPKVEDLTQKDHKLLDIIKEDYNSIIDYRELIKTFIIGFIIGVAIMYLTSFSFFIQFPT